MSNRGPGRGSGLTRGLLHPDAVDGLANQRYGVAMARVFLLSPAHCGGARARLLLDRRARFDLARRLHAGPEPTLGEIFSFMSGLYFRGKLAYARAFAAPPPGLPGILVITTSDGLCLADEPMDLARLRRFAETDIRPGEARYEAPLLRDARRPRRIDRGHRRGDPARERGHRQVRRPPARGVRERAWRFPAAFVGRGDMSRGGLLLRSGAPQAPSSTTCPVGGSARRGARPPRLARRR